MIKKITNYAIYFKKHGSRKLIVSGWSGHIPNQNRIAAFVKKTKQTTYKNGLTNV